MHKEHADNFIKRPLILAACFPLIVIRFQLAEMIVENDIQKIDEWNGGENFSLRHLKHSIVSITIGI